MFDVRRADAVHRCLRAILDWSAVKKRVLVAIVVVCVLLLGGLLWFGLGSPMPAFGPWRYMGSKYGDSYHTRSCLWADQIQPENRIYFSSSDAAEREGYVACRVCDPGE